MSNESLTVGTGHTFEAALDSILAYRKREHARTGDPELLAAVRVVEHTVKRADKGAGFTHTVTIAEVK